MSASADDEPSAPLAIKPPADLAEANRPPADPAARSRLWKTCQIPARIGCTLLFDLHAYGIHNVPSTGGVLLASNHQSYLDPVLLAARLSRPVSYFARSDLFDNRYFGALIRALHAFPVHRGRGDKAAIEQAIRRLREGFMLNMYPEGTRTRDGELQPIQRGIALVVRRAKVPVLPAAVHGSFDAWPKGQKLFHAHPIRVAYGRPMLLHELPGNQIVSEIGSAIARLHGELRQGRIPAESR